MQGPATRASMQPSGYSPASVADALATGGAVTLQLDGSDCRGRKSGYSILMRGDVQASSILSSTDPDESVLLLEDDTKLLAGSLQGETAGFVLEGEILAAEFDEPAPVVKLDGTTIDVDRWPTVKEYTGFGGPQEPVEDPFPNSNELGKPHGDPLDPEEYVIAVTADGVKKSAGYCFDIDGEVISHPNSATVADTGDRVFGYLCPGWSAEIEVRGVITRIDAGDGISYEVRARE